MLLGGLRGAGVLLVLLYLWFSEANLVVILSVPKTPISSLVVLFLRSSVST